MGKSMAENEADRLKGGIKGDSGRTERLATELRRNLHRRKQRARAVAAVDRKDTTGRKPDDSAL